jgi:hypothetical protein
MKDQLLDLLDESRSVVTAVLPVVAWVRSTGIQTPEGLHEAWMSDQCSEAREFFDSALDSLALDSRQHTAMMIWAFEVSQLIIDIAEEFEQDPEQLWSDHLIRRVANR